MCQAEHLEERAHSRALGTFVYESILVAYIYSVDVLQALRLSPAVTVHSSD